MPKCVICGGSDFYAEAGFYFCKECQTQNQDIREEVLELRVDLTTRLRKIRIRQDKSSISQQNLGWTTWEQYNFILIGMTNELIELGASMDIKTTILQLWAFYLGKVEAAFTSTTKKSVPRLSRKFHKRDAEIIFGKIAQHKKNRRRGTGSNTSASSVISRMQSEGSSSRDINKQKKRMIAAEYERFVQSQDSSEGDALSVMNQSLLSVQSSAGKSSAQTEDNIQFNKAARREIEKVKVLSMKLPRLQRMKYRQKHTTSQYKIGPQLITHMKLWALIYLALRIHDENVQLADMLRYGREGHLSYYRLDHLLPPEVTLSRAETNLLRQTKEITHRGIRQSVGIMAKFLEVWETKNPDILSLVERYCIDLQLPKGIIVYAERMMAMSPPKMPFDTKTASFPNYEGRAMAFIIVVMKILFALDGITEYEISRVAEKINSMEDAKNFSSASLPSEIIKPCVIVHGGVSADYSLNPVFTEMVEACRISASRGYQKILSGGNAVDAVVAALWWLENDEFFNCGYGSSVNNEGYVEMDACLVNGTRNECGSVAAIRDIEHPILVARYVMEHFSNTIVAGDGAMRLAKSAGIYSIATESTISPGAYFANGIKYPPIVAYFDDYRDNESADILKTGNLGAVGCIAWDGHSIVAGTSTGGPRGKICGRVGDSSLMGCGTFANEHCGCSLTGHAETIIKMGLARSIVEDFTIDPSNPCNPLKKNVHNLSNMSGQRAGGIILGKDGSWAAYCTNESPHPLPYAVVKNGWITWASEGGDRRTILEYAYNPINIKNMRTIDLLLKNMIENFSAAAVRGLLDSRLFSFREWQRYIECRRCVLANAHFPTKFKRELDAPGNSNLYMKFLAAMRAKSSDREEPEITSYKHLIPRELADSMKKTMERMNENANSVQKDVEIFRPSVTPQHSYLQQLLEDPERDLPSSLRTDFYSMKIGYMTKPEALQALAMQCNIDLTVTDTGIHFIEKIMATFEQSNLPTIREFNKSVSVEQPAVPKSRRGTLARESCEDIIEYRNRKDSGSLFVDSSKRGEYDDTRKPLRHRHRDIITEGSNDFGFDEVLPSGKLAIPNDNDSDSESVRAVSISNGNHPQRNSNDTNDETTIDFLTKYNVSLSAFERSSLAGSTTANIPKFRAKRKNRRVMRDPVTGKFISADPMIHLEKTKTIASRTRQRCKVTQCEIKKVASATESIESSERHDEDNDEFEKTNGLDSSYDFGLHDDNISILHETSLNSLDDETRANEPSSPRSCHEAERLFRPYSEYWMYHCNFSRVKHKKFRQLRKKFPNSFCWLLNECTNVIEMAEEDLYEEVCLVEAYYTDILRPTNLPLSLNHYDEEVYRSKAHRNVVQKKW